MKGLIRATLFLVIPLSLAILWISDSFVKRIEPGEVHAATTVKKIPVRIVSAGHKNISLLVKSGTIMAYRTAVISTRIMGEVKKIYVRPLDRVKKGAPLLEIDSAGLRNNIKALEAKKRAAYDSFVNAKNRYSRFSNLYHKNAVSKQQFEDIELGYNVARDNLKAITSKIKAVKSNLSYTTIKSPFSGIITKKLTDEGNMAVPGRALLVVDELPYQVRFGLGEMRFSRSLLGKNVLVYTGTAGYKAKIVEISPTIDPATRTFTVKATLPRGAFVKSGQFAKVVLKNLSLNKAIEIPKKALVSWEDLNYVYKIKNGKAILTLVRIGKSNGNEIDIEAGLSIGDEVAATNTTLLHDGSNVEVVK